jgi:hypothetical protein
VFWAVTGMLLSLAYPRRSSPPPVPQAASSEVR